LLAFMTASGLSVAQAEIKISPYAAPDAVVGFP
jgi:hypothetical protein